MSRAARRAAAERRRAGYRQRIMEAAASGVGEESRMISLEEVLGYAGQAAAALMRGCPQDGTVILQATDVAMADIAAIYRQTHIVIHEPKAESPPPSALSPQPSAPGPGAPHA